MTISPTLLSHLQAREGELIRKLAFSGELKDRPQPLTESEFYWQHNSNPMAVAKLAEGICKFADI